MQRVDHIRQIFPQSVGPALPGTLREQGDHVQPHGAGPRRRKDQPRVRTASGSGEPARVPLPRPADPFEPEACGHLAGAALQRRHQRGFLAGRRSGKEAQVVWLSLLDADAPVASLLTAARRAPVWRTSSRSDRGPAVSRGWSASSVIAACAPPFVRKSHAVGRSPANSRKVPVPDQLGVQAAIACVIDLLEERAVKRRADPDAGAIHVDREGCHWGRTILRVRPTGEPEAGCGQHQAHYQPGKTCSGKMHGTEPPVVAAGR
jgi:hypothetical protein